MASGLTQGKNGLLTYRPLRGQARSHRITPSFEGSRVPVGAGVPAKGPLQAACYQQSGLPAVNFFAGLTAALNSRNALEPTNNG
ncbi:hypothetical protein D3C76_1673380 [compost metagenome]